MGWVIMGKCMQYWVMMVKLKGLWLGHDDWARTA